MKSGFWFALALLLRLPALFWRSDWHPDNLAYLYLGAGFWRGFHLELPRWLQVTFPGAPFAFGWVSFLPAGWIDAGAFFSQALCGALLVFPVASMCRRRGGADAAMLGAALVALLHPLVRMSGWFQAEPLYLLALMAGLDALERGGWRRRLALFWLPLAALTRPEGIIVILAAALFWGYAAFRAGDRSRLRLCLAAAAVAGLVVALWSGYFQHRFGYFPQDQYAALNVQLALHGEGGAQGVVADPPGLARLGSALNRLPAIMAKNLSWWILRALPGALFLLYPILLWRVWEIFTQRRRTAPPDGAPPVTFDPLLPLSGLILLVFLPVWLSRHHLPMLLVPLLSLVAAGAAGLRLKAPRLMAAAFALTALWAFAHVIRDWRQTPVTGIDNAVVQNLAGDELFLTNEFTDLDLRRDRWLGEKKMPLIVPGDPPARWLSKRTEFPTATRALFHHGALGTPPPPTDWPVLSCEGAEQLRVCRHQVPAMPDAAPR